MSSPVLHVPNLEYRLGDLFANLPAEGNVFIPHVCNDVYVMGSGFVVPLKRRWPVVGQMYLTDQPKLGQVQFVQVHKDDYGKIVVANMVAQRAVVAPNNLKPIKYLALAKCMDEVGELVRLEGGEIHCPLFGAGLAGGNWDFIEELICELWACRDLKVVVHQLPGEALREATKE